MVLMEMSAGVLLRSVWWTLGSSEEGADLCPRYDELGKRNMAGRGCEMRVAEHMKYTDLLKLKSTYRKEKEKKRRSQGAVVCVREHLQD